MPHPATPGRFGITTGTQSLPSSLPTPTARQSNRTPLLSHLTTPSPNIRMRPLLTPVLLLSSLTLTLSHPTAPTQPASTIRLPHVVLIVVDDMGYGDPGCYNADSKIPTPNIDRLAAEGLRFTDAHAPGPLCHVSRYGLITGIYPFRIDATQWPNKPLIRPGQTTIASLLKSKGYHTAMVGKWHLGFEEKGYNQPLRGGPVDCGFDHFFGIRASTDIPPYFYIRNDQAVHPPTAHLAANSTEGWSPIQGAFWRAGNIAPNLQLQDVLPRLTDEAIQIIHNHQARQHQQPLLLYLAYPAPHTPWLPSPEFQGHSGAGLYGDFAHMVDAMIGRVFSALVAANMDQNTLLIFTSDNGPVWYPTDVQRLGHDSAGGLRGMKGDLWEAGHRMPFIVRWPNRTPPGTASAQLLCFTDLLATLAELCDVKLADNQAPDSISFLHALLPDRPAEKPVRQSLAIKAGSTEALAIRNGPWKYINRLGSGGFTTPRMLTPGPNDPPGQLYQLEEDPSESRNVYSQYPEIVERLQAELIQVTGTQYP